MDSTLVSWVAGSGFTPGSFGEVLMQVLLGSVLRIVAIFYVWTWKGTVRKVRGK